MQENMLQNKNWKFEIILKGNIELSVEIIIEQIYLALQRYKMNIEDVSKVFFIANKNNYLCNIITKEK